MPVYWLREQARARDTPHAAQNVAASRFVSPHAGHFMTASLRSIGAGGQWIRRYTSRLVVVMRSGG